MLLPLSLLGCTKRKTTSLREKKRKKPLGRDIYEMQKKAFFHMFHPRPPDSEGRHDSTRDIRQCTVTCMLLYKKQKQKQLHKPCLPRVARTSVCLSAAAAGGPTAARHDHPAGPPLYFPARPHSLTHSLGTKDCIRLSMLYSLCS